MSKDKAADYFARHQSSNECHITSDGRVFHTKGAALGFANGLKDNTVTSFTREAENTNTEAEDKTDAFEAFKKFDAETASYEDIKAISNALKLEAKSNKKADLLEAIEAFKKTLNLEIIE